MKTIALILVALLAAAGLLRYLLARRFKPSVPLAEAAPSPPASAPAAEPSPPVAPADKAAPLSERAAAAERKDALPAITVDETDADEEITIITLAPKPEVITTNAVAAKPPATPPARPSRPAYSPPPIMHLQDDDDDDELPAVEPSAVPIVYDEDAAVDEPTRVSALILVAAASQTDLGKKRRRNEDSLLVLEDHHLFVVADGMGGHAGGDIASKMAVEAIGDAFKKNTFVGDAYPDVPRRGGELALAIQAANKAIYEHAKANAAFQGMGTTVVAARFSPNKQRVYIGHVGDSRCYRLRHGRLAQVTTDHTMGAQGVTGPLAAHLNRAVGVTPGVKIDMIIARPRPDDVYLLCSDGLSKMVSDADIQQTLVDEPDLAKAVKTLVDKANARGGRDNITVILVQVKDPKGLARYIQTAGGAAS